MSVIDRFATNNNISIHYLDSLKFDSSLTPLVYVPGVLGNAEQFEDEMHVFSPRRSISISLRGRGKSDAPLKGYSLENHIADIQAVVSDSEMEPFCIMAHSMSVPFVIRFALDNLQNIKALILLDYPAKYPKIPPEWTDTVLKSGIVNKKRAHVVKGIQRDSEEIYLWDSLADIKCPVLILKGGTKSALLKTNDADRYKESLKNVEVIEFSESGHELWEPDYYKFINTVKEFLSKIDGGN